MSLQHLRKIWRTLDMPLINCEVTLNLTWVATCVNTNFKDTRTFAINQTKRFLPVVTLSTQDNGKLLQQLYCSFKRTINWNKYQSDPNH